MLSERSESGSGRRESLERKGDRKPWRDPETRRAKGHSGGASFWALTSPQAPTAPQPAAAYPWPSGGMISFVPSLASISRASAKSRSVSAPSLWVISRRVTRL